MVANAAVAMDMDVIGYDPFLSVDAALRLSRSVKACQNAGRTVGQERFF